MDNPFRLVTTIDGLFGAYTARVVEIDTQEYLGLSTHMQAIDDISALGYWAQKRATELQGG